MHLLPEKFTRPFGVGIIERAYIARTNPVFDAIYRGLLIHPTFFIKLLVMFGRGVELRPNRNHHTSVKGMDIINHLFGIGEAGQVKIVATPSIFRPVTPVLYDVIDGEVTMTELLHSAYNFILSLVTFTALPVAHGPFRHYLRLTGEGTVTANNLIHRISGNEVVVLLFLHLAPPGQFILLFIGYRTQRTQAAIRNGSIWNPFNL